MINDQEIMKIAQLARLELAEKELEQYREDLSKFLESAAKLQKIDVSATEVTSHAVSIRARLRQDQVTVSLPQESVLGGAATIADGFFQVPRIVEEQQ